MGDMGTGADLRKLKIGFKRFYETVKNGRPVPGRQQFMPSFKYLDDKTIFEIGAYLETLALEEANWKEGVFTRLGRPRTHRNRPGAAHAQLLISRYPVVAILYSSAGLPPWKTSPRTSVAFPGVRNSSSTARTWLSIRNEGDVVYYRRTGDALKISQVDALKVAYRFYKGKFSAGVIQTYGGQNQKLLLETLKEIHGEPMRPRKRIHQYFWDGEIAYLVLTCEVTSYCVVEYSSKPMVQQEQADTGIAPGAHHKDD